MSERALRVGMYAHGLSDFVQSFIERLTAGVRVSREAQARRVVCTTARRYSDAELAGFGWRGVEIRRLKSE